MCDGRVFGESVSIHRGIISLAVLEEAAMGEGV